VEKVAIEPWNLTITDQQFKFKRADKLALMALMIATLLLFGFALHRTVLGFDYADHIKFAEKMAETGQLNRTNFLYEILVAATRPLFPFDHITINNSLISAYSFAGLGVALAFYILLAITLYFFFRRIFDSQPSAPEAFFCAGLSLSLMLVAPINILTLPYHNLDAGYLTINVYNNPTVVLLKPLAFLLFWFVTEAIIANQDTAKPTLISTALVVLATLAKPNFTFCLLPVLIAWSAYRYYRHQPVPWRTLILGLVTPAVVVLAWQFYLRYIIGIDQTGEGPIIFAPLSVMLERQAPAGLSAWVLAPKFIFSCLFPLVVYGVYFRQVQSNLRLNLAWATFGVAATFSYFLAESNGTVSTHGNFLWGSQVGLLILFVISARVWCEQVRPFSGGPFRWQTLDWRVKLCGVVFSLHLLSGLVWYGVALLFNQGATWI
jgi:hypothetical protein